MSSSCGPSPDGGVLRNFFIFTPALPAYLRGVFRKVEWAAEWEVEVLTHGEQHRSKEGVVGTFLAVDLVQVVHDGTQLTRRRLEHVVEVVAEEALLAYKP